jgi:hypothetical protein
MTFNYEEDTAIDPDNMLEEWLGLSSTFFKYHKALIQADKKVKEVWEELKVCKADLIKECKEKDPKATGPVIESYYRTNENHKRLKQAKIDAEYEMGLIQSAINSFYRKEKGLEGSSTILLKVDYWGSVADGSFELKGGKRIIDILKQTEANRSANSRRSRRTRS